MTPILISGVVGLCVGSFLNVLIHRLPNGQTPWNPPRSYCPSCGRQLRPLDNIPVISYLLLRGRCRNCSSAISARYPLVELAASALFAWAVCRYGVSVEAGRAAVFGCLLLALGVTDWMTLRLPNALVGAGVVLATVFAVTEMILANSVAPGVSATIAGLVGFALIAAVRSVSSFLFRREAMGFGDVKFLGMIGLFLGDWRLVLLTVALSAFLGSVGGLATVRLTERKAVPYGVFLSLAAWITDRYGERIIALYVGTLLNGR